MVRRTKEAALETRDRILDTAEVVFSERGVARTSLADIADSAGLTRGAIYWHFKNKSDLFTALLDRVALPMEEMVARAGDDKADDPLQRIRDCCVYVLRQPTADPRCRRVFGILAHKCEYVDELNMLVSRHLECRTQGVDLIAKALRNAVRKGQLPRSLNVKRAALGLHAYVDGLIYNWLLDSSAYALDKEAEALIDLYLNGLKAEAAPAKGRVAAARAPRIAAGSRRSTTTPARRATKAHSV